MFALRECELEPVLTGSIDLLPSSSRGAGGRRKSQRDFLAVGWRILGKLFSALFSSSSSHSFGVFPEIPDSRSALSDLVVISSTWLYKFKLKLIVVK